MVFVWNNVSTIDADNICPLKKKYPIYKTAGITVINMKISSSIARSQCNSGVLIKLIYRRISKTNAHNKFAKQKVSAISLPVNGMFIKNANQAVKRYNSE